MRVVIDYRDGEYSLRPFNFKTRDLKERYRVPEAWQAHTVEMDEILVEAYHQARVQWAPISALLRRLDNEAQGDHYCPGRDLPCSTCGSVKR